MGVPADKEDSLTGRNPGKLCSYNRSSSWLDCAQFNLVKKPEAIKDLLGKGGEDIRLA